MYPAIWAEFIKMNSIPILIEVWRFNEVFYKTATPLSSSKAKQNKKHNTTKQQKQKQNKTMDVEDKILMTKCTNADNILGTGYRKETSGRKTY